MKYNSLIKYMILLIFDFLPISINKLYVNLQGQSRRFISTEGRKFKEAVKKEIDRQLSTQASMYISSLEGKKLEVNITMSSNTWMTKRDTIFKKDIENYSKVLQDSIFEYLATKAEKLDDSQIWKLTLNKEYSDIEQTKVIITELI